MRRYDVFILLAARFDEAFVIACFIQLRLVGLRAGLVGLTAAFVQGCYGLNLCPDLTLSELIAQEQVAEAGFILPGTSDCLTMLFAEPRVIELIAKRLSVQAKAALLTIYPALTLLRDAGIAAKPRQVLVVEQWSELEEQIGRFVGSA
ncbi:MAG: hypothetical protein AAF614_06195 [Chloroflexota bacterium]